MPSDIQIPSNNVEPIRPLTKEDADKRIAMSTVGQRTRSHARAMPNMEFDYFEMMKEAELDPNREENLARTADGFNQLARAVPTGSVLGVTFLGADVLNMTADVMHWIASKEAQLFGEEPPERGFRFRTDEVRTAAYNQMGVRSEYHDWGLVGELIGGWENAFAKAPALAKKMWAVGMADAPAALLAGIGGPIGARGLATLGNTGPMERLETAMKLLEDGVTPSEITRSTGWWQDPNGKWQFYFSDAGSSLKVDDINAAARRLELGVGETGTIRGSVGAVLDHPTIFEAYPDLRHAPFDIKIQRIEDAEDGSPRFIVHDPKTRARASYNIGKRKGRLHNTDDWDEALSSTLHEMGGHWVQQAEGFARGADVDMFEDTAAHYLTHRRFERLLDAIDRNELPEYPTEHDIQEFLMEFMDNENMEIDFTGKSFDVLYDFTHQALWADPSEYEFIRNAVMDEVASSSRMAEWQLRLGNEDPDTFLDALEGMDELEVFARALKRYEAEGGEVNARIIQYFRNHTQKQMDALIAEKGPPHTWATTEIGQPLAPEAAVFGRSDFPPEMEEELAQMIREDSGMLENLSVIDFPSYRANLDLVTEISQRAQKLDEDYSALYRMEKELTETYGKADEIGLLLDEDPTYLRRVAFRKGVSPNKYKKEVEAAVAQYDAAVAKYSDDLYETKKLRAQLDERLLQVKNESRTVAEPRARTQSEKGDKPVFDTGQTVERMNNRNRGGTDGGSLDTGYDENLRRDPSTQQEGTLEELFPMTEGEPFKMPKTVPTRTINRTKIPEGVTEYTVIGPTGREYPFTVTRNTRGGEMTGGKTGYEYTKRALKVRDSLGAHSQGVEGALEEAIKVGAELDMTPEEVQMIADGRLDLYDHPAFWSDRRFRAEREQAAFEEFLKQYEGASLNLTPEESAYLPEVLDEFYDGTVPPPEEFPIVEDEIRILMNRKRIESRISGPIEFQVHGSQGRVSWNGLKNPTQDMLKNTPPDTKVSWIKIQDKDGYNDVFLWNAKDADVTEVMEALGESKWNLLQGEVGESQSLKEAMGNLFAEGT